MRRKNLTLFLRWAHQAKVDLSSSAATDEFEYSWFDPAKRVGGAGKTANGGKALIFRVRTMPTLKFGSCISAKHIIEIN